MRSFYRIGVVLTGLFLLMMTSCIDSEKPLSDPQEAKPVKELLGVWREAETQGAVLYYHVGRASDKFPAGMMKMVYIEHQKDGAFEMLPVTFFVFSTSLSDRHFLNVSWLEPDQLKEAEKTGWKPEMFQSYYIYEYKLDGDKLRLLTMDADQKKSLIQGQKIKGAIEKSKTLFGDRIYFTDSSENLAKLITSPDAEKLFQSSEREGLDRVK